MRILAVLLSVLMTFATAVILKLGAAEFSLISMMGLLIIIIVFVINVLKFMTWGWLNNRYDLSKTYPLTALFFPLIFIYAAMAGDTSMTAQKVLGLCLIMSGLIFMETARYKS